MKILKFKLDGQFAFFKNPEVNSNYYFTFNNIHKVALMGILGAILGLKGYNQQGESDYPEFYEKLKGLRVSIVPNGDVSPKKKVQVFNNATMFYNENSKKCHDNLVVEEEWIEKPSWDIYIQINKDNEIEYELLSRILESRYVYIPYLGKNDHFANVTDVEVFEKEDIKLLEDSSFKLDSFYLKDDYEETIGNFYDTGDNTLRYREYLPFGLTFETNHYEYKVVEYCTEEVEPINDNIETYSVNNLNLSFF